MNFDDIKVSSEEVFEKLGNRGIILRDMKQYKLANTLRLTIGDKKANEYFIKLITKILK